MSSELIKHVTDASFEGDVLKSDKPVLVDYWAEWCGPCKMIAPILDELSKQYGDKLQIAKMNVDENQEVPGKFGIRGIPTLMLVQGWTAGRHPGRRPSEGQVHGLHRQSPIIPALPVFWAGHRLPPRRGRRPQMRPPAHGPGPSPDVLPWCATRAPGLGCRVSTPLLYGADTGGSAWQARPSHLRVHPSYAPVRTQSTARLRPHHDGRGAGDRERRPPAQAGADVRDHEEARQGRRAGLRRWRAGGAARRLRLPALDRHQLHGVHRRHLPVAEPDPPLQPPHRRHDRRRGARPQGRRALLRAGQGRPRQRRDARGEQAQDHVRELDAALPEGAVQAGT